MKAFWKSRPVKTVGILAALLVLGMLIAAATGHGETAQSGVLGTVFAPAHWAAEKISDGLATLSGNAKGNTEYEKKIDELQRQLGEMQEQLADYKNIKSQNEEYKEALELKDENSGFQYVAADVVGRDSADPYLSFTISKGAVNGVKENDAVLYGRYLIGIVKKAYPTYSIVTTVLDPDFSVSAYDINSGEVSYVTGDAKLAADGCCKFENLSTSTDITYGSIIASAGISSKLPKGLIIGTVEEVADETTNISTYAIVKPGTDIANITDCLDRRRRPVAEYPRPVLANWQRPLLFAAAGDPVAGHGRAGAARRTAGTVCRVRVGPARGQIRRVQRPVLYAAVLWRVHRDGALYSQHLCDPHAVCSAGALPVRSAVLAVLYSH